MELLNFLSQVPIPVLILVIAVLVVVTAVVVYQYAKAKGLDGIRKEVYELFLHAEHIYKESGQGEQKLKWVVQQARSLLPRWLQVIVSESSPDRVSAPAHNPERSACHRCISHRGFSAPPWL